MSEVLNELDSDWLDSDDEEYMGDEGSLSDSIANDREPLDLAQSPTPVSLQSIRQAHSNSSHWISHHHH